MGDRLQQLNQDWQTQGLPECRIRIGIFTGTIIAGSLGGKTRMEYGVIGDSVNIASRLESCRKDFHPHPCRILIAQETCQYLDDRFDIEDFGEMQLKGRVQQVHVHHVVRLKDDAQNTIATAAVDPNFTKTQSNVLKNLKG
jgi:class 3 adenylate cyclase